MGKKYLKTVLPRLYDEVKPELAEYFDFASQLDNLYITGRCDCGAAYCVQFYVETTNPDLYSISGRRPLYADITNTKAGIMFGHSDDILTGFEITGDYDDGYINIQLSAAGFPSSQILEGDE